MSISVTTSPDAVSLSKNPIYYQMAITDGSGDPYALGDTPAGYYVEVDIQKESPLNSSLYESITQLQLLPDSQSNVKLYIQSILDDELERSFNDPPIPSYNSTQYYLAGTLIRYRIRYREVTASSTPGWSTGDPYIVLFGGISQNLYSDYSFFDAMGNNNSILSWYPDKKLISADQPEYLFWFNHTGGVADIYVSYTGYTEDGTAITPGSAYTVSVPSNQVFIAPVGPTQLSLGATVREYTVQVKLQSDDSAASQVRTYRIDPLSHRHKRYLQYVNTFGCPETLRCLGLQELQLSVDRQTSERTTFDSNSIQSNIQQQGYTFDQFFTYRTGPLTRYEVDALQELLIYNNLYEVYTEGYIPLTIVDDSYSIYQEGNFLYSLQFQARPTTKSDVYSNINIAMATAQEAWRTAADDFWRNAFGITWKIA